jgi:hypothetical protein
MVLLALRHKSPALGREASESACCPQVDFDYFHAQGKSKACLLCAAEQFFRRGFGGRPPRWASVQMTARTVGRPSGNIIVLGYRAEGLREVLQTYVVFCTLKYYLDGLVWKLVQHQQTLDGRSSRPPVSLHWELTGFNLGLPHRATRWVARTSHPTLSATRQIGDWKDCQNRLMNSESQIASVYRSRSAVERPDEAPTSLLVVFIHDALWRTVTS